MIYLIIGRTGSGKDFLANKLEEKGFPAVKSYATRPRRTENEDSHIFITPEEAAEFKDKVARTVINNYEYFATGEQVKNSKVYIIDPNGLDELSKNMPDTAFGIIHVTCDNDARTYHAVHRVANSDHKKEKAVFEARDASEREQFDAFDDETTAYRNGLTSLRSNVVNLIEYENTFDEAKTDEFVEFLLCYDNTVNTITDLIKDALTLPEFEEKRSENPDMIKLNADNNTEVPIEAMTAFYMNNPEEFISFICLYKNISPRFKDRQ